MKRPTIEFVNAARVPLPFRAGVVRELIPSGLAGCYLLRRVGVPRYVGRSDRCLRARLLNHPLRGLADEFVFDVCSSPESAYLLECAWYHRLGGQLRNRIHPAQPEERSLPCPVCDELVRASLADALSARPR